MPGSSKLKLKTWARRIDSLEWTTFEELCSRVFKIHKTMPKVPFKIRDIELFFDMAEAGRVKSDIPASTKVHFQNGAQKKTV